MKAAAAFILLVLFFVVALIVAAGWSSDRAAALERVQGLNETARIRAAAEADAQRTRARAEADKERIIAQGEAAINRAEAATMRTQAAAVAMLAAVPWGVLACLGVLGVGVLALAFVAVVNRPAVVQSPPQIIERTVVYLPAPGQSRRDVWAAIAAQERPEVFTLPAPAEEARR